MSCLCGPNRECPACLDEIYIPLPARASLVDNARVARNKLPKPPSLLTFPGYKGEPSVLPGAGKKKSKA